MGTYGRGTYGRGTDGMGTYVMSILMFEMMGVGDQGGRINSTRAAVGHVTTDN